MLTAEVFTALQLSIISMEDAQCQGRTTVCSGVSESGDGLLEVVFSEGAAVVHHHEEAVAARRKHKVLQRRRPVIRIHHVAGRPGQNPKQNVSLAFVRTFRVSQSWAHGSLAVLQAHANQAIATLT
jgi:hypothetical protein